MKNTTKRAKISSSQENYSESFSHLTKNFLIALKDSRLNCDKNDNRDWKCEKFFIAIR